MNPLISPAMRFIVSILFFNQDDFGIRSPTKVEMLLNKETEPVK